MTNPTDKIINKGSTKVDTYAKKQNNLTSQILDTGAGYDSFKPMKKSNAKQADNPHDDLRKTDHTYSDLFGQSGNGGRRSPAKKKADDLNAGTQYAKRVTQKDYSSYNSKGCKHSNLTSSLDTHSYAAQLGKPIP